jgi:hypothetical protein
VSSAERSCFTLKRLKVWLRNRTSEERLVGLALLNVHNDVVIVSDEVINILFLLLFY